MFVVRSARASLNKLTGSEYHERWNIRTAIVEMRCLLLAI